MSIRRLHQIYAEHLGYFWMPCPTCGEYFGGHEVDDRTRDAKIIRGDSRTGCVLCPKCSIALKHRPHP